jgi:putative transposase
MESKWSYSHGYGQSHYHVVLVPYKRFKMFARADIRKRLESIFFSIAEKHRFEIYAMEVMEDHIHLFIGLRPSQSIAQVIQYLKGGSSRELRKVFPELMGYHRYRLWSKGKYFRPIGEVNEETIKHYIEESQSKHQHKDYKKPLGWLQKDSKRIMTLQRTIFEFTC